MKAFFPFSSFSPVHMEEEMIKSGRKSEVRVGEERHTSSCQAKIEGTSVREKKKKKTRKPRATNKKRRKKRHTLRQRQNKNKTYRYRLV